MPEATRRRFISLVGGAGLGVAAWRVVSASAPQAEPPATDPALRQLIAQGAFSVDLGQSYLDALGEPTEQAEELARVANGLPAGLSSDELLLAIRERLARDFDTGKLCQVDGWLLSRTECGLAAMAFVFVRDGGQIEARATVPDGPLAHLPDVWFGKVERWGPQSTLAGRPFNPQNSGESALWFHFDELEALSYEIFIGGQKTRTVLKQAGRFAVANLGKRRTIELVAKSGAYPVHLVEPSRGKQLIGYLQVRPTSSAE
ncbi:MAG: hypothetical protein F4184_03525 [Gemmatimonadetes bacterium]|nr:hypothetical protein [Gemmatimonadota bacterium]